MDNHFDSNGGPQNEHPIGQQNNYGVPYAAYGELAGQLAVTDSALASFFKIMEEQQVPRSDLDSKLREIAGQYKELLHHWETVQSADPQVRALKEQAIAAGAYADNRAMKGATLNNISQIYHARGDYAAALKYLEQSLAITQEIGDKRGEGVILNNIGRLYKKPDDYDTALKYLVAEPCHHAGNWRQARRSRDKLEYWSCVHKEGHPEQGGSIHQPHGAA